jgi:hypothetical protein
MLQSEAAYKQCLAERGASACAGAKAAYEADLQMATATGGGTRDMLFATLRLGRGVGDLTAYR